MPNHSILVVAVVLLLWLNRTSRARPAFMWLLRACLNGLALTCSSVSLPLGPEDRVVRRQPWVTYAIVGLCVAVFQLQLIVEPGPQWRNDVNRAWNDVVTYAVAHPYLQTPSFLRALRGNLFARQVETRRPKGVSAPPPETPTLAVEQAEFERKSENLLALLQQRPVWRWGDIPARSTWLTRLTSTFVHAGWAHLLGNLLFLLAFGPFVEDVFGRLLFSALYLGAGLVGALAMNAADPGSYVVGIGASGAISGVMGAFLVRFATRRLNVVSIASLWLPVVRVRVSGPAYGFLLLWLGIDLLNARLGIPGIGWWAHIGGFVFGVLFASVLRLTLIEQRLIDPGIEASLTLSQHPAVETAFAHRMAGRPEAAHRALRAALAAEPENLGVLREAYDCAVAADHTARAGVYATRLIEVLITRRDPDDVRETLLFIEEARATLGPALPGRFHFVAGGWLHRHGHCLSPVQRSRVHTPRATSAHIAA